MSLIIWGTLLSTIAHVSWLTLWLCTSTITLRWLIVVHLLVILRCLILRCLHGRHHLVLILHTLHQSLVILVWASIHFIVSRIIISVNLNNLLEGLSRFLIVFVDAKESSHFAHNLILQWEFLDFIVTWMAIGIIVLLRIGEANYLWASDDLEEFIWRTGNESEVSFWPLLS